jgi:bifunctional ADP-heptose synthase (sugar kinase/adenylyltransferase)
VAIGGVYTEFAGFPVVHQKTNGSLVDPQSQDRRTEDGAAAAAPNRSDRCATTQSRIFEAENTHRDRKACVEAKQIAVVGHPSDGEILKTSKTALEGLVSLVIRKGYFRLLVASI